MSCDRNMCYQQDYNGGCGTCPCNRTAEENSNVEMTNKEAIMLLDPKTTVDALAEIEYYNGFRGHDACVKAIEDACILAIEALEKQIPKTPNYEGDGYWDGELVYDTWICPNCGKDYEVDYDDYTYCPECGQAIDWSDEE